MALNLAEDTSLFVDWHLKCVNGVDLGIIRDETLSAQEALVAAALSMLCRHTDEGINRKKKEQNKYLQSKDKKNCWTRVKKIVESI
jgi:hypothetical protein